MFAGYPVALPHRTQLAALLLVALSTLLLVPVALPRALVACLVEASPEAQPGVAVGALGPPDKGSTCAELCAFVDSSMITHQHQGPKDSAAGVAVAHARRDTAAQKCSPAAARRRLASLLTPGAARPAGAASGTRAAVPGRWRPAAAATAPQRTADSRCCGSRPARRRRAPAAHWPATTRGSREEMHL